MAIKKGISVASTSALSMLALVGSAIAGDPVPPPDASWAGTTEIQWGDIDGIPKIAKRVGILAYCADIAHNAGDTGLQSNKVNIRNSGEKRNLADLAVGAPQGSGSFLGTWFLDGPFDNVGQYGAQNIADWLMYDDGIDRSRDIQVIDGDLLLPNATQLINNFDIIIAYTDNKCGQPIPAQIANSAASALAGFVAAPGKGLILTGFSFSSSVGFGGAIFKNGLSPLSKGGPGLAACSRAFDPNTGQQGEVCPVGTCPDANPDTGLECSIVAEPNGPECRDSNGNVCTVYQPFPATLDFACDHMLAAVNGPTTSSWATAIAAPAEVSAGATLCFNYDAPDPAVPFLAINAARNIIAINAFPADKNDIQKFWFGCILGNAVQYLAGDRTRCTTTACR